MRVRNPRTVFVLLSLMALAGCKPTEPIVTYTVAKDTAATPTPDATPTDAPDRYRFLGAILPADDKFFWFVKFVGPNELISPHEADFQKFVKSIEPSGTSNAPPKYAIPDGWTSVPLKPGQSRIVTIRNGKAEMYLSNPFSGTELENVNRWRKEVGLREITSDELKGTVSEFAFGSRKGSLVDFRGPTWTGGMTGPMQRK